MEESNNFYDRKREIERKRGKRRERERERVKPEQTDDIIQCSRKFESATGIFFEYFKGVP